MKITSLLLVLLFGPFAWSAHADYGLEIGFRSQSASSPVGFTALSQTGIQGGVVGRFPFSEALGMRVGFLYSQRPMIFRDDITSIEYKVAMNYFDIPAGLTYQIGDAAVVFGGIILSLNLDSTCTGNNCKINDATSMVLPIQFGTSFKFAPQLGGTVYFETLSGDVGKLNAQAIGNYRAVGVNLLVTFD